MLISCAAQRKIPRIRVHRRDLCNFARDGVSLRPKVDVLVLYWLMPWIIIVHASLLGWMRPRTMDLNQKNSGRGRMGERMEDQGRVLTFNTGFRLACSIVAASMYIARLSSSFAKSNKKKPLTNDSQISRSGRF